jgi:hypothetical protein
MAVEILFAWQQRNRGARGDRTTLIYTLFVWLINHQPAVLFSQNKSAPAISHPANEQTHLVLCSFFFFLR